MARETLHEFPKGTDIDDFYVGRALGKRGSQRTVRFMDYQGERVIYVETMWEGDEVVNTPCGFRNVCEYDIEIHGYQVGESLGCLAIFFGGRGPKIRVIPDDQREEIQEKIRQGEESKLKELFGEDTSLKKIFFAR